MVVEHCIRDGEIRNFLHRIKRTVDEGWPDDLEGILPADHGAESTAQVRRRHRSIDYTMKGLRPRCLQRKAQEYLVENPNTTWNEFSTPNNSKRRILPILFQLLEWWGANQSPNGFIGTKMKNVRSELQEHRVNAVEENSWPVDPNQKGKQNATILQLLPYEWTHSKLVSLENTRRRIETDWDRKNCWEKSHIHSGLQHKARTKSWIRTMD